MNKTGLKQQIELLSQRLDTQTEIIRCLQETVAIHMQTIILLKNDQQNLNSYAAFLTGQVLLIADGEPVPELHAAIESYCNFKKDVKTH